MNKSSVSRIILCILVSIWLVSFVVDSVISEDWLTGALLLGACLLGAFSMGLPVIDAEPQPERRTMTPLVNWGIIILAVLASLRFKLTEAFYIGLMYVPFAAVVKRKLSRRSLVAEGPERSSWALRSLLASIPICALYLWPLTEQGVGLNIIGLFILGFGFSLVTAAIPEEFFFRRYLQDRFVRVFNCYSGIALGALLFALYHFPFALWQPQWPTYGRPVAALAYVIDQKMVIGVFFGWLYYRSSSISSAIGSHAIINACWFVVASHS